jgi:hypothetical protein
MEQDEWAALTYLGFLHISRLGNARFCSLKLRCLQPLQIFVLLGRKSCVALLVLVVTPLP